MPKKCPFKLHPERCREAELEIRATLKKNFVCFLQIRGEVGKKKSEFVALHESLHFQKQQQSLKWAPTGDGFSYNILMPALELWKSKKTVKGNSKSLRLVGMKVR